MKINDLKLSLNDDTFKALKEDFDSILGRTLGNMEMKGAEEATITMKLGISLERSSIGERPITRPTFKHDISSVMQVKDKKSGSLSGDYELVYDEDAGVWLVRKIDNGQTTLFDDGGQIIDAAYTVVGEDNEQPARPALTGGMKEIPETASEDAVDGEDSEGAEDTPDGEEDAPGDVGEFQEAPEKQYDTETPYGWLHQFIGEKMRITKAMGNYTVRTENNRVVLSSATNPDNVFYCPADVLAAHVGHDVRCFPGTDDEGREFVYVQCWDCKEVLFSMYAPEEDENGGYEYEEPEAE